MVKELGPNQLDSTELNSNQTQTRGSNVSGFWVQECYTCINWSQLDTKIILDCYSILSLFRIPLSRRASHIIWFPLDHPHPPPVGYPNPHLSTCLIRHFLCFLWVVVAKAALFRGLLHINAARKVAAVHLMR